MAGGDQLVAGLRTVMAGVSADPGVEIENLGRLSGGASRETWSFDLRRSDGRVEDLILRRDPPGAPKAGMVLEAVLIQAAGRAGVPVPRLWTASDDTDLIGSAFMVVDRLEGETIPRRILRDPELARARAGLAEECGRVLAALHSIPVDSVPGLAAQDQVTQYREILDGIGLAAPAFELAFHWLEENRPAPVGDTVVHGDFRNGNLIIGPEGIRAVLDWELAHRGDPMEDLAWLCVKSWRFGVDLPVGGFGTYEELIRGYESAGGIPVDRSALLWWEILGNLKWGVICMMQAAAHTSGMVRSVELAAIGRRVCEVEWDLLGVLPGPPPGGGTAPGSGAGDEAAGGPPADYLHGSPDAAGLVEAVREFLERDVMPATEGRVRFHARVAVNVLGMVQRELVLGPGQAAAHRRALAGLGLTGETDLASAIRIGRLDGDEPAVRAAVEVGVRARLEVANPRYLEEPAGEAD